MPQAIAVRSPATSANLGPGFDCLGIALDLWDTYTAEVADQPGVRVTSLGHGEGQLPTDGSHLVARAMLAGFAAADVEPPGLQLTCRNVIPHGRGLGSSSAAIVGGLALARGLLGGQALDDAAMVSLANGIEGHPDNVAAAALGGATISWVDDAGTGRAVRLGVDASIPITVLIPSSQTQTEAARGMLPAAVPYSSAVFNISRTALLVHALQAAPELLFTATDDRLHQDYRHEAYPLSLQAVRALRGAAVPAAISGAGPTVLAFAESDVVAALAPDGFAVRALAVSGVGAHPVPGTH